MNKRNVFIATLVIITSVFIVRNLPEFNFSVRLELGPQVEEANKGGTIE